jgi:hypothetical protein
MRPRRCSRLGASRLSVPLTRRIRGPLRHERRWSKHGWSCALSLRLRRLPDIALQQERSDGGGSVSRSMKAGVRPGER